MSTRARDDEYLMIDSTAMRVHAHGANPAGGQVAQAMGRSRSSLSTKVHLACDAHSVTRWASCSLARIFPTSIRPNLLKAHLRPGALAIMDKGYDSDAIRAYVNQLGGVAVIALHPRRSIPPAFDQHIYRERHRIENTFSKLKAFRRISTRYEKLHSTFSSMLSYYFAFKRIITPEGSKGSK